MADEHTITDHGKPLLSWIFPEYEEFDRGPSWYFWIVVGGIALLVWSIVTQNYLLGIFLVIAAIIVYRRTIRKPESVQFVMTQDGVQLLPGKFYGYTEVKSFAIVYNPPTVKTLFFTFKAAFRTELHIPLQNMNPLEVRRILTRYVPEDLEREAEPMSESIGRSMKI